jgi:U3 small nucleolar RNA-associated protein 19
MVQPIRLIDFLKDSYDVGGVVSLLALHGLFILITKHNLYVIRLLLRCWVDWLTCKPTTSMVATYRDYPDFYRKLYALFQPNIFHVKYRAKFFRLVNIFLKSSYVS